MHCLGLINKIISHLESRISRCYSGATMCGDDHGSMDINALEV